MSKFGMIAIASTMLLAFGCGDGRGDTDAGGIVLMDSGPGGTDSGPGPGVDSGTPPPTGCSVAGLPGLPPLPASCLPRCSNATFMAVGACGMDGMCQNNAIDADTTAPINVDLGMGMSESINCSGCFNWMINTCLFDACPTQLEGCLMCADQCNPDTAGCETEEGAFDTCLSTNMASIQSCVNSRAGGCFDTGAPFFPDFEPREFQLPAAMYYQILSSWEGPLPR